jgi:hypothetical protein
VLGAAALKIHVRCGHHSRQRPIVTAGQTWDASYEAAANSTLPETAAFAERLSALCVSGPMFRNLDVVRADEL